MFRIGVYSIQMGIIIIHYASNIFFNPLPMLFSPATDGIILLENKVIRLNLKLFFSTKVKQSQLECLPELFIPFYTVTGMHTGLL